MVLIMKELVLGIDGGATKSHLALFRMDGTCIDAIAGGPLNHEVMEGSYAELDVRLNAFISDGLGKAGVRLDDIAYAVFGIAGVDTNAQHSLIYNMLCKAGFQRFSLYNDAFLGVAAGCPNGIGICAINGTGFKFAAVDHSGVDIQTCGLGDLTADYGGGGWYGTQAIASVSNEMFKRDRKTIMRDMLFAQVGISRKEDFMEVLSEKLALGMLGSVAINSIAFEAAAAGDAVAMGILELSALHYAGGIIYLATEMDFPEDRTLYITLAGSVFIKQKVKILPQLIERKVCEALGERSVEFLHLDAPPVAGAVLWAAQKAGFGVDMVAIRKGLAYSGLFTP